jgi:WD40 repeat protein/tRNA A-37 threonylcarbamoyl transferase component Bud32
MDRICDGFEAAWKVGRRPRIEDHLSEVSEEDRAGLLLELLGLDLAYRHRGGERPTPEEYQTWFPDADELIAAAFNRAEYPTEPRTVRGRPEGPAEAGRLEEPERPTIADELAPTCTGDSGTLNANGEDRGGRDVDSPSPSHPAPVIPGYEIVGELGRGAMGVVYQARQVRLNRPCALKMILAGQHASPEATSRFLAEAKAVARLRHPHIIQIHGIGEHEGRSYLELEHVEGGSLADRSRGTPWPPREAACLVETLARAIAEAHRLGIVHRDLKPANVLLAADGTPKITDFGLAKMLDTESGLTRTETVMGTPSYMAPEQALGRAREAGPAADVYALGAIFYELLAGRPPFKAATAIETLEQVKTAEPLPPSRLVPGLPRDAETIALKCLQKEPSKRYASAGELAEDLRRFLAREPIRARRVGHVERLWGWCRRNPPLAALAASVALLLVVIAAGVLVAAWRFKRDGEALRSTLRDSYLVQAQALRWSGRPGRRFAGLDTVAKAAKIRPGADLREEAIACMALTDLRVVPGWEAVSPHPLAVAFDAAIERYALADDRGNISVRLVADHREVVHLHVPGNRAWTPQFSPDGRYLAAMYDTETRREPKHFIVWHLERAQAVIDISCGDPGDADFSPDSHRVAVCRRDGPIAIFNLDSGREVSKLGRGPTPYNLAWHPDGSKLAAAAGPIQRIRVYDLASGGRFFDLQHPKLPPGLGLAWSPDGTKLAQTCDDGRIHIWDLVSLGPPMILSGHSRSATYVAFSHRGDLLATAGWDKTVRLWDPLTGNQLLSVPGTSGLQFSPDDRWLGFSVEGAGLRLCEVAGNREFRAFPLPQDARCVDFSPDGRLMAVASADGMRLWDASAAKQIGFRAVPRLVSALFTPDGRSLITSGDSGLQRWPIAFDEKAVPPGLRVDSSQDFTRPAFHSARSISLAADGRTLAVTDPPNNQTAVLDLQTGEVRFRGEQPGANESAISPDGRWLAGSTWPGVGEVRVWDLQTGKPAWTLPGTTANLAFSPDGRWLVTGAGAEYQVREVGTWRLSRRIPRDSSELLGPVAFARNGPLMAIVPATGQIRLIDARTLEDLATLTSPESSSSEPQRIRWLAISPDGTHLAAVCTTPSAVHLWDLHLIRRQLAAMGLDWHLPPYPPHGEDRAMAIRVRSQTLANPSPPDRRGELVLRGHEGPIRTVAFGPDGRQIITGGDDATVRICDAATGRSDSSLRGPSDRVWAAFFHPDGKRLITSCADFKVRIHDATTGEVLKLLNPTVRDFGVARLAVSRDARRLAAKDGNRKITLWDLETGERIRTIHGATGDIYGLAISPDGHHLASSGDDRMVRIWDCESGQERVTLRGHLDTVDFVAYSSDGQLIATASWDRTVKLWDAATGRKVATLRGHTAGVWGVAFSPDGKRLASVGEDGTVRLWDASTNWRIQRLLVSSSPTTSVAFSPDGRRVAAASLDGKVRVWELTVDP